jgi:hypothetical protein
MFNVGMVASVWCFGCRKVLFPWTDERLGNCNYLDTCNNTLKCK